eukprot:37280_1
MEEQVKAWALLAAVRHCPNRIPFSVLRHPSIDYLRNLTILDPTSQAIEYIYALAKFQYINNTPDQTNKQIYISKECQDLNVHRSIGNRHFSDFIYQTND